LDDEKSLIDGFIQRNNIQVVSGTPDSTTVWEKNGKSVYLLTASGLYFHMVDPGDTANKTDIVVLKNTIVPRYLQYTLGIPSDTVSNLSTIDFPYPTTFVYGDLTNTTASCTGFQEAVSYLKRNYTKCKIIVPSKIGFNANMLTVTPMGYDLSIQYHK